MIKKSVLVLAFMASSCGFASTSLYGYLNQSGNGMTALMLVDRSTLKLTKNLPVTSFSDDDRILMNECMRSRETNVIKFVRIDDSVKISCEQGEFIRTWREALRNSNF